VTRDPGLGKSNMPSLSPVARDTLQEQAYLRLREALMSGHFLPRHGITLRAAAEALGTSPMPVRDALRRLEIEHVLVPRSNRTLGVPEMTYASLSELREVRMALKGLAAEKAALLIVSDDIAVVESHYQALAVSASAGSSADYMRANWLFHTAIYRASRSNLLVSLIEPTWMRIGPYVRLMLPDRRALIDSLGNHLRALQALRQRSPICTSATAAFVSSTASSWTNFISRSGLPNAG
jgi:DNA-binding GntR family transcriptional regulator